MADGKSETTLRAVPHYERWLVVNDAGDNDGWSYPTKAAAEAAIADPQWPEKYKVGDQPHAK